MAYAPTAKPTPFAIKARGIFHMSFALNLDVLTVFEIIGIVLAVIGFLNLSTKLDKMFSKMENGFVGYADWKISEARSFWPPHKNKRALAIDALQTFPIVIFLFVIVNVYTGWGRILIDAFQGLSLVWKITTIILMIIGYVLNELFTTFILARIFAFISSLLSRSFLILSKPPSGMTGSVGLIISIVSFAIGHVGNVA